MSEKTAKTKKQDKQIKKAIVVIIVMSALLLLDGLAYAALRLRENSPRSAVESTPQAEATSTPEPTPEPEPVYSGGYFISGDGLFYPERTLTRGELFGIVLAVGMGHEHDLLLRLFNRRRDIFHNSVHRTVHAARGILY